MKRIGVLTAGGDTPALNATIRGAVVRANQRRVEVIGFIKGFSSLLNPRVPHVRLNPLFCTIPELDDSRGGTIIGASRDYVDHEDHDTIGQIVDRLRRLEIDGLICIGGDGTLNGMQALSEFLPTVLAPKTIDNDLGLNYRHEADEWVRDPCEASPGYRYRRGPARARFDLEHMVNYATPGYATAVFVSATGVQRIRTTAESHRRIAIIEVMGRHAGRRGRCPAADSHQAAGRHVFHQQAAKRIGEGRDFHSKSRAHPARRPADSVRSLLRGSTGRPSS